MEYVVSVTQKGQITLPKKIRDMLNIQTRGSAKIVVNKKHGLVQIKNNKTISDLAGSIKVDPKKIDPIFKKHYGINKERDFMQDHYEEL